MTSIFVAKLDFNTTDDELKSLFEAYGKVNRVTIAKDRETNKPRGFAFVEMFNEAEAEAAITALDNSSVHGRTIAVKKADDRGARPAGGPGGGGGQQRSDSRPPRQDFNRGPRNDDRPPRTDDSDGPFRRPEGDAPRSFSAPDAPAKADRKKEKDAFAKKSSDKPKQNKMEAYKKSGKNPRFLDDDDDDDWSMDSHRRGSAWDEEE